MEGCLRVGQTAPAFEATAVYDQEFKTVKLSDYKGSKYVVLFFYPLDFTFVCPTEILAYQKLLPEFEKRNVAVVGCSTDTEESHLAWLLTPKNSGGIEGVKYPIVADASKTIAKNFGVLGGDWDYNEEGELIFDGAPIAFRGTFLIDKEGIVRHEYINFFPLGRNIQDSLRIVDAWHHHLEHGEVCPANWEAGAEAMHATREGVAEYLAAH